jgi:hypothetical protein
MENGVKDQIEQFNWQRDMEDQPMPSTMKPFKEETKSFCERVHKDVLFKVYRRECIGGDRLTSCWLADI